MSINKAISIISLVFLLLAPLIGNIPSSSGEPILQSMNFPLKDANASFRGVQSDAAGSSVDIVGDLNGDGFDDLLIGAPGQYANKNAGKAYLFFGKASGWTSDLNITKADVIFTAEKDGDKAGFSVSGAGDVNGDGLDDFLISAPYNNDGGSAAGKVYLVLGRKSGWAHEMGLKASSASFVGVGENDNAGFYVDGAGDVNGDGLDDILIFAAYDHGNNKDTHTYLILGKKDGWTADVSLSKATATITGTGYCLFPLAGVGDVNGDGMDDLLVLGPDQKIYLMFGASLGWSGERPISNSVASFVLEYSQEQCPAVSKIGDVNGDGLNDLLISSPLFTKSSNTDDDKIQGKVYLVFGKKTGWTKDFKLSNADASYVGAIGDVLGWSHSGGGDVNGDGLDDFAIMAGRLYGKNNDPPGRPETYLILGNKSGWAKDVAIEKAAAASYLMEDNRSMTKALSVSLAGDANGDGMDDLLIGDGAGCEQSVTYPSSCPGETYLVFPSIGKPDNPPKVEPVAPLDVWEGQHLYVRINASDLDGDHLTYSLVDAPPGATISASGDIEYVPVASDYRPDPYTIKVVVSDGRKSTYLSIEMTVHFELMTINAGPVRSVDGIPLDGAQIIVNINGTPLTNTTAADGMAHIVVPKSLNGSKVEVTFSKEGWNEKGFQAKLDQNKGLVPTSGEYPKLSKRTETRVAPNWGPLLLLILIILAIAIILLFHRPRGPVETKGNVVDGDVEAGLDKD